MRLFPRSMDLDELRRHRRQAQRQLEALDLEILRERARVRARGKGACVALAERRARVGRDVRSLVLIMGVSLFLAAATAVVMTVGIGVGVLSSALVYATSALVFVSTAMALVSMTPLSAVAVRAGGVISVAIAVFSVGVALPFSAWSIAIQAAGIFLMIGCWVAIRTRDPHSVAVRLRRSEWYLAFAWASGATEETAFGAPPRGGTSAGSRRAAAEPADLATDCGCATHAAERVGGTR